MTRDLVLLAFLRLRSLSIFGSLSPVQLIGIESSSGLVGRFPTGAWRTHRRTHRALDDRQRAGQTVWPPIPHPSERTHRPSDQNTKVTPRCMSLRLVSHPHVHTSDGGGAIAMTCASKLDYHSQGRLVTTRSFGGRCADVDWVVCVGVCDKQHSLPATPHADEKVSLPRLDQPT